MFRFLITHCDRIMNKTHMYDATEIFRTMGPQKNEVFFKLGFYLLSFFYYLYRCVGSLHFCCLTMSNLCRLVG